jgi:hypothetical protein
VVATITSTLTIGAGLKARNIEKRQLKIVPSAVPPYASACTGAEYGRACSCWGITATTTTVATPVTVVTKTATATTSVCPSGSTQCLPGDCFDLLTNSENCGSCGNKVGYFLASGATLSRDRL